MTAHRKMGSHSCSREFTLSRLLFDDSDETRAWLADKISDQAERFGQITEEGAEFSAVVDDAGIVGEEEFRIRIHINYTCPKSDERKARAFVDGLLNGFGLAISYSE